MHRALRYGRHVGDFEVGAVLSHPWEVTIDHGFLATFASSFLDATPVYASDVAARDAGFKGRPVAPMLLLNLGLSFSVHDVSERAIANLAYIDARFPQPCYPGDTVRARSRVLGLRPVTTGDKAVVHVRTEVVNQDGALVCTFERKALVRGGKTEGRPADPWHDETLIGGDAARAPSELYARLASLAPPRPGFALAWDDFEVGDTFAHEVGRTVSDAEAMQLATLLRNSHPLHTDEQSCRTTSFAKTRVVYGGLVLAWVLALASRDTAGHALWDLGLDEGAHPAGVLGGDTLYAASRVEAKEAMGPHAGSLTLRVVGLKNAPAGPLFARGADLFTPELGKTDGKVAEKVVEITRTLLVRQEARSMIKIKKIDHVAVAVHDTDAAIATWKKVFGLDPSAREVVASQKTEAVLLPIGDSNIELISPKGNDGLAKFLEKRGPGIHHIAVEVEGIELALAFLRGLGVPLIDETPRIGARGHKVAFVHPKATGGVLVELVEEVACEPS